MSVGPIDRWTWSELDDSYRVDVLSRDEFAADGMERVALIREPRPIEVLLGKHRSGLIAQAFVFPKPQWSSDEARAWIVEWEQEMLGATPKGVATRLRIRSDPNRTALVLLAPTWTAPKAWPYVGAGSTPAPFLLARVLYEGSSGYGLIRVDARGRVQREVRGVSPDSDDGQRIRDGVARFFVESQQQETAPTPARATPGTDEHSGNGEHAAVVEPSGDVVAKKRCQNVRHREIIDAVVLLAVKGDGKGNLLRPRQEDVAKARRRSVSRIGQWSATQPDCDKHDGWADLLRIGMTSAQQRQAQTTQ